MQISMALDNAAPPAHTPIRPHTDLGAARIGLQCDHVEQCSLACARRAHDSEHLPGADGGRDASKNAFRLVSCDGDGVGNVAKLVDMAAHFVAGLLRMFFRRSTVGALHAPACGPQPHAYMHHGRRNTHFAPPLRAPPFDAWAGDGASRVVSWRDCCACSSAGQESASCPRSHGRVHRAALAGPNPTNGRHNTHSCTLCTTRIPARSAARRNWSRCLPGPHANPRAPRTRDAPRGQARAANLLTLGV